MMNEVFNETNIAQKEFSQKVTLLERMKDIASESENFEEFFTNVKNYLGWIKLTRILEVMGENGDHDLGEFYEKYSQQV